MTLVSVAMLVAILAVQSCSESSEIAASIHDIKAKYEDQLMAKPGVVSVDISKDDRGNPVIGIIKAQ